MIPADEPDARDDGPGSPLRAMLAAAIIIALALVAVSLGHRDGMRNARHYGIRDPAIHRFAPEVVVQQPVDDMPDASACPEPEPPLLC